MKKYTITLLSLLFLFLISCNKSSDTPKEEWIQLFNGKNLDGWSPKITGQLFNHDSLNTFRVEDGLLKVVYSEYDSFKNRFGHLFFNEPFSYYKLRVEYRFVGEQLPDGPGWAFRNSGIMVHGQIPGSMGVEQDFPVSMEVQLLGGDGAKPRSTANLCTPGTNYFKNGDLISDHCTNSSSETFHGDQWVTVEVEVYGDSLIRHLVNGNSVFEYEKPQIGGGAVRGHAEALFQSGRLLSEGSISLQSESHPVEFRKVELLNLVGCTHPESPVYKPWAIKDDGSCGL